jgi:predicted SAM-dependent methyltransferase
MSGVPRIVERLRHKLPQRLTEWGSVRTVRHLTRSVLRHKPRLISKYLTANTVYKLHLGCGYHRISGWLNCDLDPMRDVIILDVTRPLPFTDGTFDFIYCEHMIEHIPYASGRGMLEECRRVLKPGGTLRIATPDVRFLFALYREDRSTLEAEYIAWSSVQFVGDKGPHTALGVINNFMRDWGHVFLYDPDTLRQSMEAAGFLEITPMKVGQSNKQALKGLENTERMPATHYDLETFILEATK